MVYQNKFVAAIKVGGKVLREVGNHVYIPFGSEYSILLKNLNSVRVKVQVSVDGSEATDATWLVVEPNSDIELERSIKCGNWTVGNRFKFIERTAEVEAHRGVKADDGIVRIEYQTEIPQWTYVPPTITYTPPPFRRHDDWDRRRRWGSPTRASGITGQSTSSYVVGAAEAECFVNSASITASIPSGTGSGAAYASSAPPVNETGITVEGSISNQQFVPAAWFQTGASEVLVLVLRGAVNGRQITEAVTVKHRTQCKTCGKSNDTGNKFCAQCGTSLQIV